MSIPIIFKRRHLVQTAERAVKTFFQVFAAMAGVEVGTAGLADVDWSNALSVAATATIISVAMSIGSGYIGDDSPSVVD